MYNTLTLKKDKQGNIHMWEGIGQNAFDILQMDGREADTFIQREEDKEALQDGYLTRRETVTLEAGYWLTTNNVPDDYLIHD